jgi:hypothetical protein
MPLKAQTFDAHRWQDRLLVLYADRESGEVLARWREALAGEEAELKERDLKIYILRPDGMEAPEGAVTSREDRDRILGEYRLREKKTTWVLIGKDGGEKMRGADSLPLEDIFRRIDSMPMRQREMREQKNGN